MKIKSVKKLIIILVFTMLLAAFSSIVFAKEVPGFELPVTVSLIGAPPTNDSEYVIVLKADNPEYPMPEASKDGEYQLSLPKDSTSKFPIIEFPSLGVYTYEIYQLEVIDDFTGYDDRVYNLVVYVTNKEDGSGLETTVILYLTGQTEKLDQVLFEPEDDDWGILPGYVPDPDDSGVKTGIQTNAIHYATILGFGVISFVVLLKSKKDRIDNR